MKSTSAILKELTQHEDKHIPLAEVMKRGGSRAHGLGLLLFALPETLPIPIPSVSLALGIPLVVISGHLILFGEGKGIPRAIRDRSIPASLLWSKRLQNISYRSLRNLST